MGKALTWVQLSANDPNKDGGDFYFHGPQKQKNIRFLGGTWPFYAGAITCLCALRLEIALSGFLGCTKNP
jgi:hypothetical protein